ncbi:MAG: hypothetical protein HN742_14330 [Lentisphaerae bacterium]|jgi:hypothetical protein|nr:hypothetical protein [Lentisphaerota bacterium]MBT4814460.1 hypothetical protein [Lentisphaerota bacterium]MBT5608720.1 hypothetical protein [Lentisphaerota bacterium]MBT7062164.1 hypothetical protein [Lentisphaerota bacterium]MBT7843052.1 hypothetical protein [Lentisphaerota bacterium]
MQADLAQTGGKHDTVLVRGGICFLIGLLLWAAVAASQRLGVHGALLWVYHQVGITAVALAPLSVWGLWVALCGTGDIDETLAYIGTTAQRFGLLGTTIGLVAATVKMGSSVQSGAASAVSGALPAVGQALLSTAVGFVIAIGCDFCRYLRSRETGGAA